MAASEGCKCLNYFYESYGEKMNNFRALLILAEQPLCGTTGLALDFTACNRFIVGWMAIDRFGIQPHDAT